MSKIIACSLFIILCVLNVSAQDRKVSAYFFGEIADASAFGYKSPSGGMVVGGSYRVFDRLTLLGEYTYDYSEKTFLDNGHSENVSAGARVYLIPDRFFVQALASVASHENDTYTKRAFRGNLGAGVHGAGFTAVLSFFGPSQAVLVDPNGVSGMTVTVDYEKGIFNAGPASVGLITSGQYNTATFTQTGDLNGDRFRGSQWSGRTGFIVRF